MPRGSTIVMDNARIHKNAAMLAEVEERGYRVLYLPAYSPDYNPIELAFSAIKSYVRRAQVLGNRAVDDDDDGYVYQHLTDTAYGISADTAQGFFHQCRYV